VVALLTIPLQFLAAPIYAVNALDFFFEYVLAFAIYGIASLFPNIEWKFPIYTGVIVVNLIRLAIHVFAGVFYWESTWWASFIYNAWYMIPTLLLGLVLTPSIVQRIKR
jgi:thiamine transporter